MNLFCVYSCLLWVLLAATPGMDRVFMESALHTDINGPRKVVSDGPMLYILEMSGKRVWAVDVAAGTIRLIYGSALIGSIPERERLQHISSIAISSLHQITLGSREGLVADLREQHDSLGQVRQVGGVSGIADMAYDTHGRLLIVDQFENAIFRWDPVTRIATRIAGNGTAGYQGDGAAAAEAELRFPRGIALDQDGNLLIADYANCRIRMVSTSGIISTIAGNGVCRSSGDGQLATKASLDHPVAVAAALGSVFLVEAKKVRRIDRHGIIHPYAGNGGAESHGNALRAEGAALGEPVSLAIDEQGNVYVADYGRNRIRRIDAVTRNITTVAGTGLPHRIDPVP